MSNTEIILIILLFGIAGIKLYQKYIKKDAAKPGTGYKRKSDSSFSSLSKDDDYEPYSKKQ